MPDIHVTIDGKQLAVPRHFTILDAAKQAGIEIPSLCAHPELKPIGACRICLVEVEKQRVLQPACTFPVSEGMVVHTQSPAVREARRFVLDLLLSDHPLDCMTCEKAGNCTLQDLAYDYGLKETSYHGEMHNWPLQDDNPFYVRDYNKCILCRRCVRACNYVNGVEAISVVYRGFNAKIAFGMDSTMEDSPCEFCGSCVEVCPVAALWPKQSIGKGRAYQLKQVETVCSYCGVGCKITLHVKGNEIVKVTGANGAANHGFTCVKGRFGYDYVNHADRLRKPLMRRYLVEGGEKPSLHQPKNENGREPNPAADWVEVSWDQALDTVARKLAQTKEAHGGDAFAALCSARCTNEENFLMMKLARQVLQTHNIDHCARL